MKISGILTFCFMQTSYSATLRERLIILFKTTLTEDYKIFLKNYLVLKNKSIIVRVIVQQL